MDPSNSSRVVSYAVQEPSLCREVQLKPEWTNPIGQISTFLSDLLKASTDPINAVKDWPTPGRVTHIVKDASLQRLFEQYHRYGKSTPVPGECPFTVGKGRERVLSMLKDKNILTLFEDENQLIRKLLQSYFNLNCYHIEEKFANITKNWVEKMSSSGPVKLFESVNVLTSELLIKGILGYDICSQEDVQFNASFWKDCFAPIPSQLVHVGEQPKQESGVLSYLPSSIQSLYQDSGVLYSQIKRFYTDRSKIYALSEKIIAYSKEYQTGLYSFLKKYTQDEELLRGSITSYLVFGETTSYLLGYLLYEYGCRPDMQDAHGKEVVKTEKSSDAGTLAAKLKATSSGCYRSYFEALRLYPTGGAGRLMGENAILKYTEIKDGNAVQREHYLRKGELISCIPILAGRDKMLWDHAEEFDCNRDNLEAVRSKVVPFGSGAHACIGEKIAETLVMAVLSCVLKQAWINKKQELPELIDATVLKPIHDIDIEFVNKDRA